VVNFVLKAPTKDEQAAIEDNIIDSTKLVDLLLAGEFDSAMLKLHTKK
jgi:PTH1 family peptidyl-tRNA hydrolase